MRLFLLPTTLISNPFCELILEPSLVHIPNNCLSDVGCKTVANMIKGKTPEEIRKLFNIANDFTPEEEVGNIISARKILANLLSCKLGANQERERE